MNLSFCRKPLLGFAIMISLSACSPPHQALTPKSGARLEYRVSLEFAIEDYRGRDLLGEVESIVEERVATITPVHVTSESPNRLVVDLPEVSDSKIEEVKQLIARPGELAVAIVAKEDEERANRAEVRAAGGVTSKYRILPSRGLEKSEYLVRRGSDAIEKLEIDHISATFDEAGSPALQVSCWSQQQRMGELTALNLGGPLAIICDGQVTSVATIQTNFQGTFRITGSFTQAEVDAMITVLSSPLDVPPALVNETRYGE